MYTVYWYRSYTQTFLSCFFIFTSFNATSLILLAKIILIWNCKTDKGGSSIITSPKHYPYLTQPPPTTTLRHE